MKNLTKPQLRALLKTKYLSAIGKKTVREVLAGKYDKSRRRSAKRFAGK